MNLSYFTADAFTSTPFAGAQVAVFPNAQNLSGETMQSIAAEFNLNETVFVSPSDSKTNHFSVFTYTPRGELNFGAHTVIAAAHVLASTGAIKLTEKHTPCTFQLKEGELNLHVTGKDGRPELVQFSMSLSPTIDRFTPLDGELSQILSLPESAIAHTPYRPLLVSAKQNYLVVPVTYLKHVRNAVFDYKSWAQSAAPATMAQEILLVSTQTEDHSASFHARLLGPSIGLKEDPPIGAAIPAFAAYLSDHSHIKVGTYTFAVERGLHSTRKSIIQLEIDKRAGKPLTLRVGGQAVLMSEGTLRVAVAA